MQVRPKKRASRKGETQKPLDQPYMFPAPIRGWVLNESRVAPQPGGARILDNWICDLTTIRVRKGHLKYATLNASVQSLFTYKSGATETFFASDATSVYDITSPADADTPPTADITGLTDGYWVTEQFGTAGGDFLLAVNGADDVRSYDGTSWSVPAITGVTLSDLSDVWSYANRLFFVEKDTMKVQYLAANAIAGAVTEFSLAGVFERGGSLFFGANWSVDAGDGFDDKCVFFSTEGEVAIYTGTDPAVAADWRLEGLYRIARPLGKKGIVRTGGDILIATEVGLVPLSEVLRRDVAALSLGAVSSSIEPYWQEQAAKLSLEWEVLKWDAENIMLVTQPETVSTGGSMLCANQQTGAWSRWTGMDARCMGTFDRGGFFGSNDNSVYRMQSTGADDGAPYVASYLGQHDPMGAPGLQKTVSLMRPTFRSTFPINPQLVAREDYSETLATAPPAVATDLTDGWDVSTWDSSLWDATAADAVELGDSLWVAVGITGYALAPELQLTFGGLAAPDAELIGIDASYRVGALVA